MSFRAVFVAAVLSSGLLVGCVSQEPEAGSLAKPSQVVRVVLSLGARQLKVPDLTGLPPRAAALRLAQESLQLGAVSWYRDGGARVGIAAQDPEPETAAGRPARRHAY